jgi:type I restriction enzyme R subunit
MSPHAYSEDQLVEQPAIGLFAALGWQTLSALAETFGPAPPVPLLASGVALLPRLLAGQMALDAMAP